MTNYEILKTRISLTCEIGKNMINSSTILDSEKNELYEWMIDEITRLIKEHDESIKT